MARVVVVGAGFAGISAAARLAKLRHDVTIVEPRPELGGQLLGLTIDGERWYDNAPTMTLLGALRDLFRKSGRTLDRELDVRQTPGRHHFFADGTEVQLRFGTRGDQHQMMSSTFGANLWSGWVDDFADPWNVVRRQVLDVVPYHLSRDVRAALRRGRSAAALARTLREPRLIDLALAPIRLAGHDPRRTPGFALVPHWLERNFAVWQIDGGPAALAQTLSQRLELRKVRRVQASALDTDGSSVTTDSGRIEADAVVWTAPTLPRSAPRPRLRAVAPMPRSYVRITSDRSLPHDLVVHGEHTTRLWHCGGDRWTIQHAEAADLSAVLRRLDLTDSEIDWVRSDDSTEVSSRGHYGWQWNGWRSAKRRPIAFGDRVYVAGAAAHPGAGIEAAAMATSAIAATIGPAWTAT